MSVQASFFLNFEIFQYLSSFLTSSWAICQAWSQFQTPWNL